ncbi:MAG: hypothetical protein WB783_08820 [Arenicellales bacterium]
MSLSPSSTLSRFVHIYKGVEEFYFLNQAGELGYIKAGELRSVKETFPQLKDRAFLNANPHFLRELEELLRELGEISAAYPNNLAPDLELGYVLPAGDQYRWRTSTLVLHKHVLQAIQADHDAMVRNGAKGLIEAERDMARVAGVRSIHQGLDELTHHRDATGLYRYFPALFVVPEQPDSHRPQSSKSNVRVINLRWRDRRSDPRGEDARDGRSAREILFSVLRDNLSQRGAIDRSQRLENRISIG